MGQYIEDHAGRGQGVWARQIYGSRGSMALPGDRSGRHITLNIDGEDTISDEKILELVPDFHLDAVTTDLWGGNRLWRYDFSFSETDRKIIAIEYGDFAGAISGAHPIEVDAAQGTRSVAVAYAILESGASGHIVTIDDMLAEQIDDYQREINEGMGI